MTTATYHGHARIAASHLIDRTPLGALLDLIRADVVYGDHVLTLTVPLHAASYMSTGEGMLLDFLLSLGQVGTVNIGRLLMAVDADCARIAAESMLIATGQGAEA